MEGPAEPGVIRVCFAIPQLDRGGPDRVVAEVIAGLDRTRFAPSLLLATTGGHHFAHLPADVPVEVVGGATRLGRRYPVLESVRYLRRAAPDVVVATQRMILTLGLARRALPARTRLVMRQANDVTADFAALVGQSLVKHRVALRLLLVALRGADAVIAQSESMRRDITALLGRGEHLHVIGNPIDIAAVAGVATKRQPGAPALVSIGRLAPQKGFDVLLPAIAALRAQQPDLHLTILGDGPDRTALAAQARELGLASAVTFAGQVSDPVARLAGSDLFVLASRYEGFSNAALEALAVGTPIVLTDCPGASADMVRPGANGRLAACVDAGAMTTAMATALGELGTYDRQAIREDCRARFGAAHIVGQYERVISGVVRATHGAP